MKLLLTIGLVMSLSAAVDSRAADSVAQSGALAWKAREVSTFDGRHEAAESATLTVPENRAKASGRTVELAFVRLKSKAEKPGPPIVFLMGGAGRGIVMLQVPPYFDLFDRLRGLGEVIVLDQRGIGESTPALECPPPSEAAPADTLESASKALPLSSGAVRACAQHWRAEGVDLAAYSNDARAEDLEDLRRALGVERLNLLAMSAGTEVALAMLRQHGDRVGRAVLAGTVGPDDVLGLPAAADMLLKKVAWLVGQDPAYRGQRDLVTVVRGLMTSFAKSPLKLTVTDAHSKKPVTITVGTYALQTVVQGELSDGRALPRLPAMLYSMAGGDYASFTRKVERLYNSMGSAGDLTGLLLGCTAGWSPERRSRIERESKGSLLSSEGVPLPDLCLAAGVVERGAESRAAVWSATPTLFLTGTLDGATPSFQAEEVRYGFPNGLHIVVENSSHETLPAEEVQLLVKDFFAGKDVSGHAGIRRPAPRFEPIAPGPAPSSSR